MTHLIISETQEISRRTALLARSLQPPTKKKKVLAILDLFVFCDKMAQDRRRMMEKYTYL